MGKRNNTMDLIRELQQRVFKFMVETELDLCDAGLYDNPELPAEEIPTTEEMIASLAAAEAYERVMREIIVLSGIDDPGAIFKVSLLTHTVAEKVNSTEKPLSSDETCTCNSQKVVIN